ncbi:TauD/TfdA dioxygenase family protein [Parvibaculum sp.]|uniref:TauD/TfdA dioxygenase family protein n=1 Tax=Parvibaculum sp. TaxID=2024848 RepID=UPI00391D2906
MTLKPVIVRPLGGILGGEVLGIDLSAPAAGVGRALACALSEYGVLVCREGNIPLEEEQFLGRLFSQDARFHCAASGGLPPARFSEAMDPAWHDERPAAILVRAEQVPAQGGESIWSSLHAAYRSLSAPMRRYLATLNAAHVCPEGQMEIWRPLVAPHPVTCEACLDFSPDFTSQIGGVPEEESRLILKLLRNHVYTPENQIRIPWCEGMLVLWDCRIAHHYPVGGFAAPGWRLTGFSSRRIHAADPPAGENRTG